MLDIVRRKQQFYKNFFQKSQRDFTNRLGAAIRIEEQKRAGQDAKKRRKSQQSAKTIEQQLSAVRQWGTELVRMEQQTESAVGKISGLVERLFTEQRK